ncbi:MAG: hypothetical protein KDD40_07855, partial [Bdellovibrionales bacterium]|nr:hypothetical protein [Bdellovibrionales bacterium]
MKSMLALLLLLPFAYSQAKEDKMPSKPTILKSMKTVKWYFPEIVAEQNASKTSSLVTVVLSGSTESEAKITLGAKEIPVVINGKVKKFKRKNAIVDKKNRIAVSNKEGLFVYKLKLPVGEVRIPLAVKFKDNSRENFQLNLNVKRKDVEIVNQKNITRSPIFRKQFAAWLGLGVNYVRVQQE